MTLEEQLQDAYQRAAQLAPVPPGAYDRFLRRRARRGRAVATATGLALVAVLGAAVLVARQPPQERETVAPAGGVVRVPAQGFELPVPAGWKVQRQLTGPGSQVVGVVLVPRSGELRGAAITVAADPDQPPFYFVDLQRGARERADGRLYKLRPGPNAPARPPLLWDAVGRYAIAWPAWPPSCRPLPVPAGQPPACARAAWRVLLVTGTAAPGDLGGGCWRPRHWPGCEQMLEVMRRIVGTVRPIGNAVLPPGAPGSKVLLGKGGSGRGAWEAWIAPIPLGIGGPAGFMMRWPLATPKPTSQWQPLEPRSIQRHGVRLTHVDCLSWLPGADLLLSGLAREDVATVRIELAGRRPVEVSTFGRDQPVPWVGFVSPPLPSGPKVDRVIALDAAGKTIGTWEDSASMVCPPPRRVRPAG
jgi:hypothetical protein